MGVIKGLYKAALISIHYSMVLRLYLGYAVAWVWTSLQYLARHKGMKLEAIQNDAQELDKIPLHLTVIVTQSVERLSVDELAQLVVWALACGVQTVSLYHPNDALIDKLRSLRAHITRHHEALFSPPLPQVEVTTTREAAKDNTRNHSLCAGHTVLVLSSDDGRERVTQLARQLSTEVFNRRHKMEELDLNLLTDKLTLTGDLPDPDLALIWGATFCSLGYPPWQLRLTEIQTLSDTEKLTYWDFLQTLQIYARCQQRFGK